MRALRYLLILAAALAAAGAYAYARNFDGLFARQQASDAQVEAARQQLDAAEKELAAAKARVDGLGTDKVEVEREIRRKKGYVRPGEKILQFEAAPDAPAPAS